jgi:hypothetical protein
LAITPAIRRSSESVQIEILEDILIAPIVADARMRRYGMVVKVNAQV